VTLRWSNATGRRRITLTCRFAVAILAACLFPAPAAGDEATLWHALRSGGHIALLRHADAPGIGDPEGFRLGDCATQRNLGDKGRGQAARIGERFRANGLTEARVLTSQWCRCLETARLLRLGLVAELPVLNSFFQHAGRGGPQTRALRQWIAAQDLSRPVVLVTHQVNITELTGVYPTSGELVIVRRVGNGALAVAGTVQTE
jgi:8-oxo-(d)GTP phosphatase